MSKAAGTSPRALSRSLTLTLAVFAAFARSAYAQSDGFDGTVIDRDRWEISAPLGASRVAQNDALFLSSDGTNGRFCSTPGTIGPGTGLALRRKVSGDFDLRVDFSGLSGPGVEHSHFLQTFFGLYQDRDHQLYIKRIRGAGLDGIQTVAKVAGGLVGSNVMGDSATAGTFRIKRVGNTIVTFFNGAESYSITGIGGAVIVMLQVLGPGGAASSVVYDNFQVAGTVSNQVSTCAGDSFDGNVVDALQWEKSAPLAGSTITQNDALFITSDGTAGGFCYRPQSFGPGAGLALRKRLAGDFDIQVEFSGFSGTNVGDGRFTQAHFDIYQDRNHQLHIKRIRGGGIDGVQTVAMVGGAKIDGPVSSSASLRGTLRIVRKGDEVTTFLGGTQNFSVRGISGDVVVALMLSAPAGGSGSVVYDNFHIDAGTLVDPLLSCVNHPPVVNPGGPYAVDEGQTVTLFGSATDPEGSAVSYRWDLDGDGSFETVGQNVTFSALDHDGPLVLAVRLEARDGAGVAGTAQTTVTLRNVAPTASFATTSPITVGQYSVLTLTNVVDPSAADRNAGLRYTFACDGLDSSLAGSYESAGPSPSASCPFATAGTFAVKARVFDKDQGQSTYVGIVGVNPPANRPPVPNPGGPYSVAEEGSVMVSGSAMDPEGGAVSVSWDLDDDGMFESAGATAIFSAADIDGPAQRTIHLRACDGQGACAPASTTIAVVNVAPTATLTASSPINEGGSSTLALIDAWDVSGADRAAGLRYAFACDGQDVTLPSTFAAAAPASSATCLFKNDGTYLLRARVFDEDSGHTTYEAHVVVNNVAPTVGAIISATDPQPISISVAASATFVDPGVLDTHTALWDWGDGTTSAGAINGSSGAGSVAGSHVYANAGIYTLRLTLTDDAGASGQSFFRYVVIFNPGAGSVSGKGHIDSVGGDCPVGCGGAGGKGHFGVNAQYGAGGVVSGGAEFEIKTANLAFTSRRLDWLVINGAYAKLKGSGTVNGAGNYQFLIVVGDSKIAGGPGQDGFRIKIWEATTGAVQYDNVMGAGEDTDQVDEIKGGSLRIKP